MGSPSTWESLRASALPTSTWLAEILRPQGCEDSSGILVGTFLRLMGTDALSPGLGTVSESLPQVWREIQRLTFFTCGLAAWPLILTHSKSKIMTGCPVCVRAIILLR